jgi:hypothetical protein
MKACTYLCLVSLVSARTPETQHNRHPECYVVSGDIERTRRHWDGKKMIVLQFEGDYLKQMRYPQELQRKQELKTVDAERCW